MTNSNKPITGEDRKEKMSGRETIRLELELPKGVINRLEILAEAYGNDAAQVLAEAVMRLWDTYYTPLRNDPMEVSSLGDRVISDSPVYIPDRRQRVLDLHGQGVPVEDIAREVDWSEDGVKQILGIEVPPYDRQVLQERARTMRDIGMSLTAIARQWNEEGVPTFSGQGRWHHTAIKKLLAP